MTIYVFRCPECGKTVEKDTREPGKCSNEHHTVLGAQWMQRDYRAEAANLVPPKT